MQLRDLRKTNNLTLEEVSKGSGVSVSLLSKLETGKQTCSKFITVKLECFYKQTFELPDVPYTKVKYNNLSNKYKELEDKYDSLETKYYILLSRLNQINKISSTEGGE